VRSQGIYRYWGYKKGYIVKIWVCFIAKMYWEGGSTKGFWEIFTNI
jgi:hypothetical protein